MAHHLEAERAAAAKGHPKHVGQLNGQHRLLRPDVIRTIFNEQGATSYPRKTCGKKKRGGCLHAWQSRCARSEGVSWSPEGCGDTPRYADVPLEKPWLCLRTAVTTSSSVEEPKQPSRSRYLNTIIPASHRRTP